MLAILCCVGASPAAFAAQAGNVDELRPLYANMMDVEEGKQLAQSSCAKCHGVDGVSTNAGVPNLAGQRSPYLFHQLRAFGSGARAHNIMNGVVKFLSTNALVNVAAYYASLEPAQPAAGNEVKEGADPVQAGRAAAASCAACHGETGVSKTPGVPNLIGQNPQYLRAAVAAYKGGQRKNDTMKAMVASVSDADLNKIALYFALQKANRAQTPAAGNAKTGQALASVCAGCHGAQGVSGNPSATPSLAGQDASYLDSALHGYKSGTRSDATMKGLASGLDDAGIKNLAAYYASLQPQAPTVSRPMSTAQWVERCNRCHGANGNSTDPNRPALAAQRADYLQKILASFRSGARHSPEMAAMSAVLSDDAIQNIAAYYAHQKARTVVFSQLPCR